MACPPPCTQVVSYGISINLVEVTWKSKIKAQFPNPNDYSVFMGNFSTCTGTVTFAMMLLSRIIFRKFGWGTAALITPTLLLITGLIFFSLLMFPEATGSVLASWGMTPLYAAVLVGGAQNIFSKSAKYSLFDPCKEMAYIPLDDEVKTKVRHGTLCRKGFLKTACRARFLMGWFILQHDKLNRTLKLKYFKHPREIMRLVQLLEGRINMQDIYEIVYSAA